MPYNKLNQEEAIYSMFTRLENGIYTKIADLKTEAYITPEPVSYSERMTGKRKDVKVGEAWGDLWECGWFHFTGEVPKSAKGKKVVLYIDIHGELCVFDKDGVPVRGLTSGTTTDHNWKPKKREYVISECAEGGETIDIWADAGCNDLFGDRPEVGIVEYLDISICNDNIKSLYYDVKTLYELMNELDENTARYCKIRQALFEAACKMRTMDDDEIEAARIILAPELNKKGGDPDLSISAIGHAHIDLAWLWPIRETKRKGARTFSTAIRNMEKYPDYVFGASQPQLYSWIKEEHPGLYEQIRRRIAEGRWEAQGAMWVEADTNVSGGEALIRQILYGKKFFREEFGKDMEVLWLPDVFGYTGALPQILKKSGVPYFMTIKLSWSRHNVHPHHTFNWVGIDGSEILVHMPPEGNYSSFITPKGIKKAEREYIDKYVCDEALMLFGIGDGGGGPGEEHLEALKREKNLSGLPPVKQEASVDFFHRLDEGRERYKTFRGELYLEKHQGTYTTQARNKKYNRKMENLLREAEFAAVAAGVKYPKEELERIWKEVLLYQFHDILPGSSIKRVYDESLERYAILQSETEALIADAYGSGSYAINSLSWERREWIKKDNKWYNVTMPAMGSAELADGEESAKKRLNDTGVLENDDVKVCFDESGAVTSLYDKRRGTETLTAPSNRLAVYCDDGDAWDFSESYREREPWYFELTNAEAYADGPLKKIVHEYKYGESTVKQTVSITDGSAAVTFDTEVDWRESGRMLRTAFYTDIKVDEVTCDIQFGNIKRPTHRNTSWDMAKYEICAHKYADLSDDSHGVALLNDCKYGYCAEGGMLDLNLLRSPEYPGVEADRAVHTFKYALYPHSGDLSRSDVLHKAYEFNRPINIGGKIEQLISVDNPDLIIESVKKAESDDSIIVRLYEAYNRCGKAAVKTGFDFKDVYICDLMENELEKLKSDGREVNISAGKFEIMTLKFVK